MENTDIISKPDETAADNENDSGNKVFVPVKFNKEIRNLELDKAAALAQKGLKFEAIADDYQSLKRIAKEDGQSVSEFLNTLKNSRREDRKKELTEKCGGNEEMAEYVLGLEGSSDDANGFDELTQEFPEIKDISDLPESVVENARLRGTLLLDEYLRYRLAAKRAEEKAKNGRIAADNMSIGSQTDRKGGINPETAEFLKGLWR